MKTIVYPLCILLVLSFITGCRRIDENSNSYLELSRYIGERISVESISLIPVHLKDGIKKQDLFSCRSKMYFYVDSAKCTECKASALRKIEKNFKDMPGDDFTIIAIVRGDDYPNIKKLFETYQITAPLFIDPDNSIKKNNSQFPNKDHFHVFLTVNDTIVALGSPVDNPKLVNLYKRYITHQK